MRSRFDEQLAQLERELIEMGALCEESIALAAKSLGDGSLARQVAPLDTEIDRKERDIESLCLKLLLQQQPVARDLRQISAALKMITDLERIGDQAEDIAEITLRRGNEVIPELLSVLSATGREAVSMIRSAIAAYASEDLTLAAKVIAQDDVVDNYFSEIKQKLTKYFAQEHPEIDCAIDYLMIAKYLERIGDHAVNLAEWVQFCKTGIHKHQRIV